MMPMSPVDGLMVPTKATTAIKAMCWKLGNANPVSVMMPAPLSISVRKSWRGAMAPIRSVRTAVPSSEAVSTTPIWMMS